MGGAKRISFSLLLVLIAFGSSVVGDITTDGLLLNIYNGEFSFVINDTTDNTFCLRASFGLSMSINYNQYNYSDNTYNKTNTLEDGFPENLLNVSTNGSKCNHVDGSATLVLSWNSTINNNSYTISMTFLNDKTTWSLYEVNASVSFYNSANYVYLSTNDSSEVFSTKNDTAWFKRTFLNSQYYHCDAGQDIDITLPGDVISSASKVRITQAVIYMGSYSNPTSAPCLEDWIAAQEKIVPIIVGGVLAVLLLLIFIAYAVSFIQRKRKEKLNPQYEQLSGKE